MARSGEKNLNNVRQHDHLLSAISSLRRWAFHMVENKSQWVLNRHERKEKTM